MQANRKMESARAPQKEVAERLKSTLASNYTLYLKTQNYHWNVEGRLFFALHKLLEEQYQKLASFNDTIAERIRALDEKSPGSFEEFSKLSSLKISADEKSSSSDAMIDELTGCYETLIQDTLELCELSSENNDPVTDDLGTRLIEFYQDARWMLRSLSKQDA